MVPSFIVAHLLGFLRLSLSILPSHSLPDVTYPDLTPKTLAFGSCHSRKSFDRSYSPDKVNIWDTISSHEPDAFLWLGDAIYPPNKLGNAPVEALRYEYEQLRTNATLGYSRTMLSTPTGPPGGIHGTYDDHDYGGNDRGEEMPNREDRRDAYLDFLGVDSDPSHPRRNRSGLYSSISFGTAPQKILVLFLDTRWGRERHCIPSIAASIPFGAVISCVTRWIAAGLNLPAMFPSCRHRKMLSKEQWTWLEQELKLSDAQAHIIVSSVQVLTTNPVVESWGHFPEERDRLLRLINGLPGLVLLSGDVHHADMFDALAGIVDDNIDDDEKSKRWRNRRGIMEVTSSGLTHSCVEPFYGALCSPILNAFPANRFRGVMPSNSTSHNGHYYYTGRNYGTLELDWSDDINGSSGSFMTVNVHGGHGSTLLSTGTIKLGTEHSHLLSDEELLKVRACVDGHLRQPAETVMLIMAFIWLCWIVRRRKKMGSWGKSKIS